jgi:hypothetical protein
MNVYGGLGGCSRKEEGERTLRVKRMEVCYIYPYEDSIMNSPNTVLEREEKGKGVGI